MKIEIINLWNKEIEEVYIKAKKIFESDLEWKDKFHLIFSDEISKKVNLDYCDPDTSYEEDVSAFMDAFDEYFEKWKKVQEVLG